MSHFGDLLAGKVSAPPVVPPVVEPPVEEPVVETAPVVEAPDIAPPKRARNDKGHYVADDPSTPENEAWVGGVSPKKSW